ncbi:MAG TPA: YigZ family protein [Chryseosolibacter sp.]|nr:YigZ family protein [Chryseosolibacter sp.]
MQQSPLSYRTIAKTAEGLYREKGSRFLAFAYPVTSELEVKEYLAALHKKYYDARHHCFAWILGTTRRSFRAFDDGEPNHSAGDPILGQIRSRDLTNVLVVVVRYFGGVKLGVGGLVSAYKTAAEEALNAAEIVEREITDAITITYDYEATPDVMRLVKDYDLHITGQKFEAECELVADYKIKHREKLLERLSLMQATGVKLRVS